MKKILAVMAVCLMAAPLFAEMRTWKDVQGRTLQAEMTGVESSPTGPKVQLKLPNGKTIAYPFAQLSAEDQKFVQANQPFDPRRAAAQIDQLIMAKLKSANGEIKGEKAKVAADRVMPREDRLKRMDELDFLEKMTIPTPKTTDEQFVRRVYLDIAGRIPTYQEAEAFLEDKGRDKRSQLIDKLLGSEAFVSHFFNYTSDLLRIRSQLTMDGGNGLQARAYMDWMKDQIRADRPWDQVVTELMTAQGAFWDNPATGFIYTDLNMPLCNLSNTFTVFLGTEITCAQCHDHPFEEVYQMDFFKMAAFFGRMEYRYPDKDQMAALRKEEQRLQADFKKASTDPKIQRDDELSQLMGAYNYVIGDSTNNKTKLPHDYKYDDAEPNQTIAPAAYFGEPVNVEKYPTARHAFASWMTSKENPRFTINLVNRLWKYTFGLAQIEPVYNIPGHLDGQAQNYDLLKYLEKLMKDLNYDVKDFLRVLYNTETYQREACYYSPTMAQVDKGEYHFPAPILRRLSAEQIWDSMVALTTANPDQYEVRVLERYKDLMHSDWSKMTLKDAEQFKMDYQNMTRGNGMMMSDGEMMSSRVGGELMVRASEMNVPAQSGHFLEMFGQSDKRLIENSTRLGSVPQVMMMMNGRLTNQVLPAKDSNIMTTAKSIRGRGDTVDAIFLSILSRRPTEEERGIATRAAKVNRKDETVTEANFANLIWALLNTREFMFIQ